jgi:hypothetical protein
MPNSSLWRDLKLSDQTLIGEASEKSKLLFVFVRHRGCTFCREALTNLSIHKKDLVDRGYKIIVVHMGPVESSEVMKKEFDLTDVEFISDPERTYYKAFGARRANLLEALGPQVIAKGLFGGKLKKYGVGKIEGDGFQLGGVFTVENQKLEFIHNPKNTSDVEDWSDLISSNLI